MSTEPAPVAGRTERRPAVTPTDLTLIGVVAAWGFSYVPYKWGLSEIPTGLFNLLRYLVVVPLFWVALLRSGEDWRLPRRDWARVAAIGVIGVFVYSLVFSTAAKWVPAANTSLLLALSPVWGVLLQWIGGHGAPSLRYAAGSLIAFAGTAVVLGFGATKLAFGAETLLGNGLALAAGALWAWYGVAAQPLLVKHSGTKVQAWINLVGLVGFVAYQVPVAGSFRWADVSGRAWFSLLIVAVWITFWAYRAWYNAIAKVGPERALLAMYLIPAVAAVSGALFLGQTLNLMQLAGAAMAMAGVAIVRKA